MTTVEELSDELKEKMINLRSCPNCGFNILFGMPGSMDAICRNCGYKDPCCSD